jgi:hypothetical protein
MKTFYRLLWKQRKIGWLAATSCSLFATRLPAMTNDTERRFENSDGRFTITLTPEWKEMSTQEAEAFINPLGMLTNNVKSAGYELRLPEDRMAFVFVNVTTNARVPDRFLALLQNDILRRKTILSPLPIEGIAEKDYLDSSFDTNRHLLRISISQRDELGERTRLLQGTWFTELGAVSVTCLTAAEAYPTLAKTFLRAVETLQLDSAVAYRPRPVVASAHSPQGTANRVRFMFGFVGLIGAAVLTMARYFSNRVMSDEV